MIVAPSGNVLLPLPSLFASSTACLTAAFSLSVKFVLSTTSVGVGVFTSVDIVLSFPIVFGSSPGFVIVTDPSSLTLIWSSVKSGFAFLTASLIACFSSGVKFAGSFTATFDGSFNSFASAGFLAVAFPASVDSLFEASFAFALTSVLSFTLSAGIVTTPDAGSIFRPLSAGSDQLP